MRTELRPVSGLILKPICQTFLFRKPFEMPRKINGIAESNPPYQTCSERDWVGVQP